MVTIAVNGDFGKPRPALVVQGELFPNLPTVIVCPLTSELRDDAKQLRIDLVPTVENGLREPSQVMVDKVSAVPIARIGKVIGRVDDGAMLQVGRALAVLLGIV